MSAGGRGGTGREGTGVRLLLYLALVILVLGAAGLLVGGVGALTGSVAAMLVASLTAGWVLLARDGHGPGALGFGLRASAPAELGGGVLVGVALLLPVLGVLAAAGVATWSGQEGTLQGWLVQGASTLAFLGVAAAAEEALVRGYPLQLLARAWGPMPAVAATSVAFGAFHMGNPSAGWLSAANVTAAGVFLGVLTLRTGSLWWATGAHLGWNWGQAFLADLPVSGLELVDAPFWEGALQGPGWLAGGGFGVEGSVLTALAMGGAAWWAWRTPRLRPAGPRWWRDDDEQDEEHDDDGGPAA